MRDGLYPANVWAYDASSGAITCTVPQLFGLRHVVVEPYLSNGTDLSKILPPANGDVVLVFFQGGDDSLPRWAPRFSTLTPNSVALGADTTGQYVSDVTGTTNQITATPTGTEPRTIVLSTPQDIHSGASPNFIKVTAAGGSTQFPTGLQVDASSHATSEHAEIKLGGWAVGQDSAGTGTKDFFVYDSVADNVPFLLDTSGRMRLNKQPYFLLRHSATVTVADSTAVDHPWDTEVYDSFGFHASSNAYVTVPVTGLYFFAASVHADNVTTAGTRQLYFIVDNTDTSNDNTHRYGGTGYGPARGTASGYVVCHVSAPIYLTAGQTVYTKVYQTTGASQTWGVANRKELNYFTGCLLWAL